MIEMTGLESEVFKKIGTLSKDTASGLGWRKPCFMILRC